MKARNPGPFTLDGTRVFLVGRERVAVVDPGPEEERHLGALFRALKGAREVTVLLTHGHPDHAGGAASLGAALGARVLGPPSAGFGVLREGDVLPTDQGELVALETPGHTRDHLSFLWPAGRGLFPGDLVLGRGSTTWIGEYPECVADYLASLRRIRELAPEVLYPAHGPPVRSVARALEACEAHRRERIAQVEAARRALPGAGIQELAEVVYGRGLPPGVAGAARATVAATLFHLEGRNEGRGCSP